MNKAIIFAFLAVVFMAAAPTQALDLPLVGGLWPIVDGVGVGGLVDGPLGLVKPVPIIGGAGSRSSSSSSAQSSASSSSRSQSGSGSIV